MGSAAGVGNPRLGSDWTGGPDRTRRRAANGDPALNPRRRRLGFILAAAGVLSALFLPLSSEAVAALSARSILLALTLAAALLFAASAWTGGSRTIALGFAVVLGGAATTLVLLRDPGITGSAAAGFWALVRAVWLGAGLGVVELASQRPRGDGARRALILAVPLLFGAVVFYLWEVFFLMLRRPP